MFRSLLVAERVIMSFSVPLQSRGQARRAEGLATRQYSIPKPFHEQP